ncbi:MAG: hypothetical protein FWD33_01565 [Alphaproteobacteria bacterium]|nr:hypothetical protein [Alphaproteobacteria bacterium]
MKKFWLFFKTAAEDQWRNPTIMAFRLLFLAVVAFVTLQLWLVIGYQGFAPADMVWYVVMGETIIFSIDEKLRVKIQNDIRTGNIGYSLMRPFTYLSQKISENFGSFCARLPIIMTGGIAISYILGGGWPSTPQGIGIIFVLMIMSGFFAILAQVVISLLGIYMQQTESIYIIWNKLLVLFGGLFFPLTVYPQFMTNIAYWTPFPWALYEISRLTYEFSWAAAGLTAAHLAMWCGILFLLANRLFAALIKKVSVNGN